MTLLVALLVLGGGPTRLSKGNARVVVPSGWVEQPSGDPERWVYRDASGQFQLTVSTMSYARAVTREQFAIVLQRRVDGENQELPEGARLKAGDFAPYQDGFGAEFGGTDPGSKRTFAGRLLMARGTILTVYLEGLSRPPKEFAAMRAMILPTAELGAPVSGDAGTR